MLFPFKSKYKYVSDNLTPFMQDIKLKPNIPDYKLKISKKLSKPDFSNEPGCWEADLMFVNTDENSQIYLVMINVNTRYLIVEPIGAKSSTEISYALCHILDNYSLGELGSANNVEINTIKIDGERGFKKINEDIVYVYFANPIKNPPGIKSNNPRRLLVPGIYNICFTSDFPIARKTLFNNIVHEHDIDSLKMLLRNVYKTKEQYINDPYALDLDDIIDYKMCDIKVIVNSGKFTLAHKIVDRVIATIRNAFGYQESDMLDYNKVRQIVNYYNNTPHRSLQLRNYDANWYDLEEYRSTGLVKPPKYIYLTPAQMQNNRDLEWQYIRMMRSKLQEINKKSLLTYKRGNIILVHLDYGKSQEKFAKQRRVFNNIATFLTYEDGNVACKIFKKEYTKKNPCDFVPIIYTKLVANNYDELDNKYKAYFNI